MPSKIVGMRKKMKFISNRNKSCSGDHNFEATFATNIVIKSENDDKVLRKVRVPKDVRDSVFKEILKLAESGTIDDIARTFSNEEEPQTETLTFNQKKVSYKWLGKFTYQKIVAIK
jgi:hypothetical protein